VSEPRELERARCTCDRPTRDSCPATSVLSSILRRVDRACTNIERAVLTTRPNQGPRLMYNAQRAVARAIVQVDRREVSSGQLSPECGGDLKRALADAHHRIGRLVE
jgi:hypothetical protein